VKKNLFLKKNVKFFGNEKFLKKKIQVFEPKNYLF